VVFEDEDIPKSRVAPQIDDPFTVSQEDVLCTFEGQDGQGLFMPRRFDQYFMGPNPIHLVIDPFAFSVQFAFDSESGEFIGDDAQGPAGRVGRRSVVPERKNLRRGPVFVAFTEGTESADGSPLLRGKIRRSAAPLGGDDHPSSMNGVFSELGHRGFVFGKEWSLKRGSFF
jgi:hypothetical protein